jgi:signal transduction histidine kinase
VFRIFQEAIANVVKHAAARGATVHLRLEHGDVVLQVSDDGRGFDTGQTGGWAPGSGRWGLVGMRERVALLGGTLAVHSRPGGGTRVTATIPTTVAAAAPPEPAVT